MPYREDGGAEAERLSVLASELAASELQLARRASLVAAKKRARSELRDAERAASTWRAKIPLPLLARVHVASPCHARWDEMSGDERVRHCGACDKDVYDLSEMTEDEAETLLRTVGESACVRLRRRADGTVMTSDCPVGAERARRRRVVTAVASVAGAAATALAAVAGATQALRAPDVVAIALPMPMPSSPTQRAPRVHNEARVPQAPHDPIGPRYAPIAGGIRFIPYEQPAASHGEHDGDGRRERRRSER